MEILNRKNIVVLTAAILFFMLNNSSIVKADQSQEGVWIQESENWWLRYPDGSYPVNCWKYVNGYWYHFDRAGYMETGWIRSGGYSYYLGETGELARGWCYREETEQWHYFNQSGYPQQGWLKLGDIWYWFNSKGEMVNTGYRTIDGNRYYFYNSGEMASGQYVGTFYMNENGHHECSYDIKLDAKNLNHRVSEKVKQEITDALQHIPRKWIQEFVEDGWEIMYYPEKSYFSAPQWAGQTYYVYHKLDTDYKKLKFCNASSLTSAFGEYIAYASGCMGDETSYVSDLWMNYPYIEAFVDIPDFYSDDMDFYFGKLVETYLNKELREELRLYAPMVCEILNQILYSK